MVVYSLIFCLSLAFSKKSLIDGWIQGYYNLTEIETYFQQIHTDYPDITEVGSLGVTYQNNNIPYMKLTSSGLPDSDKPVSFFTATLSTGYPIGSQAVIHAMDMVLQDTKYLTSQIIYFVPIINIDAWKEMETNYASTGQIEVRLKNLNTGGCATTENGGVNLNRNFAYSWGNSEQGSSLDACQDDYRGVSAASEQQTQRVQQIIQDFNPGFWLHYDWYGEVIEIPLSSIQNDTDNALASLTQIQQEFYSRVAEEVEYQFKTAYERTGQVEDGTILDYAQNQDFFPVYMSLGQAENDQEELYNIVRDSHDLINYLYWSVAHTSVSLQDIVLDEQLCEGATKYTCDEGTFSYFVFQYEILNDSPLTSQDMKFQFSLTAPNNPTNYSFEVGNVYFTQQVSDFDQNELTSHEYFVSTVDNTTTVSEEFQIEGFSTFYVYIVFEKTNSEDASGEQTYAYSFVTFPSSMTSDTEFSLEDSDSMVVDETVRDRSENDDDDDDDGDDDDDNAGVIAAIVIVIIVLLIIIVVVVCICWKRAKNRRKDDDGISMGQPNQQ